jgi:ABC-type lipoprotein release transport system permease subunit
MWLGLGRNRRGAIFSAIGVGVGIGSLVFFVSLGLGVAQVVREKVFPVEVGLLEVVPASVSLGGLAAGKLDKGTLERLTRHPEVAAVFPKMSVRVPSMSRYDGGFFGSQLRMSVEVLAVGVDPGLVKKDVQLGDFADPPPGQPVPALISGRLLDIYNTSFAPIRRLPRLSAALLVGFTFPVQFNRSMIGGTAGPSVDHQVQIVGVSERALLAGITLPLQTAIRLNRSVNADAESYSAVTLLARSPSAIPTIVEEVKKMGLRIDDQERRLAESVGSAVAVTTSALALLSVLICLLAAINIAHALFASVVSRAKEIGIMQAVGASRADIRKLILSEAAVVGLCGGIGGTLAALAVSTILDRFAGSWLPSFPFKPESFFLRHWSIWAGGVLLGLVAALAGAYFPSRYAARMDPARTVA